MALRARLKAFRAAGFWPKDGSTSTMRYASGPITGTNSMTISHTMLRPVRNKCTTAKSVRAAVNIPIGIPVWRQRGAMPIILDLGKRGKTAAVDSFLFCDRIHSHDRSLHVDDAERSKSFHHARGAWAPVPSDFRRHQRERAVQARVPGDKPEQQDPGDRRSRHRHLADGVGRDPAV